MSRGPDAMTQLGRVVVASAAAAGCTLVVEEGDSRRWASATFAGERHTLRLTGADTPALGRWLAGVPDAEFALRGHLVADAVVAGVIRAAGAAGVTIEAVTLEEA